MSIFRQSKVRKSLPVTVQDKDSQDEKRRFLTTNLTWIEQGSIVLLYLMAIVTANLLVVKFGPLISIPTAFVLIGFDLTSRDKLHEAWRRKNLVLNMFFLIASGSAISWLLNGAAGRIALASMIAFCASSILDTAVYSLLRDKTYMVKVNGSNIVSGASDSILFPTIAFGTFMPLITIGQFGAKVVGGFLWSLALASYRAARGEK